MIYTITAINGNEVTLDRQPPSTAVMFRDIKYNSIRVCRSLPTLANTIICYRVDGLSINDTIEILDTTAEMPDPNEVTSVNQALRYNEGKPRWSLVDWKSMEPMVQVLEFGAKKYSEDNWKKPMDKEQILNSAMRHLIAMMSGEENDPESGLPHVGHLMCNAMFYSYHSK